MFATLLVLSVLQLSPADAPRLDTEAPRALSLLTPSAAASHSYGLLSHEHEPGVPANPPTFSVLRAFGEFFAGFGFQLVAGSFLWVTELVAIFGATIFSAAITEGRAAEPVFRAGINTMITLNGLILPLLSAIPIWAIANGSGQFVHSFMWTWLSGVATYAAFWAFQVALPSQAGPLGLLLYPTHVASWLLTALVQTVIIQVTRQDRDFASRAPSPALLNVEGRRVALGTPLPALVPDASRPGRMVPMLALAQGRF